MIDGIRTELKTTGVRVPKGMLKEAKSKSGKEYNLFLRAKEGISITGMTLEPTYQSDFFTSHFWEKAENLLIVFYEYKGYEVVPASRYADFPIVGYCYNQFTASEITKLKNDWEIVRDYIKPFYTLYPDAEERREKLEGFTRIVRPQLMLIELVPGYKKNKNGHSYRIPRYRLKQTFVDYIVRGHFDKSRSEQEINLQRPIESFYDLDHRCHEISEMYHGKTLLQLKDELEISLPVTSKNFASACIIKMFGGNGYKFERVSDFVQAGIIVKTITLTSKGCRTEDMKLKRIDFQEWADRDVDFYDSEIARYFSEHSFLCPIFCEMDKKDMTKTIFQGFKRFSFDEKFLMDEVRRTWEDSRKLIYTNTLRWKFKYKDGLPIKNRSGSYAGSPNFPKSKDYIVFFRAGAVNSSDRYRTEVVNDIKMLPQYFWLKGAFLADKLASLPLI